MLMEEKKVEIESEIESERGKRWMKLRRLKVEGVEELVRERERESLMYLSCTANYNFVRVGYQHRLLLITIF